MIDRIKECAEEDGISQSLWVREAIEVYLKYQERLRQDKQQDHGRDRAA